mmetsp:Transcript_15762/g.47303  ORF Transcript_15762/g.47303 Transcript_15762/m.47303 type:complete len:278 (+) Transcript_15762:34-867(+)
MGAALVAGSGPCGIGIGECAGEAAVAEQVGRLKEFQKLDVVTLLSWENHNCGVPGGCLCKEGRPDKTIACDDPGQFEFLMEELFRVHDLNENGLLEELELIQLNKKIAMLHYGKDVDLAVVTAKYRELYRSGLDPEGQPVPYPTFRRYMTKVLSDLDPDVLAQEMIMQQFVNEAVLARAAFHFPSTASVSDLPFVSKMQADAVGVLEALRWDRGVPAGEAAEVDWPFEGGGGEAERGDVYVFRAPPGIGVERIASTSSATLSRASPRSRGPLRSCDS